VLFYMWSVCACAFSLCFTLFDQGWKKITMYSLEEAVGGNDRDCPCVTSFPCTYVCVCVCVWTGENRWTKGKR